MNIRLLFISGASALLLLASIPALAAENANLEPAGITPAHPLYSFDLAWDWARLNVLNRDPDDRALTGLLQAEERLSELSQLKNENNLDALRAHRLSSRYENLLMRFQQRYEQKIALGEDIAELQSALRLRIGNHVDVLDEIATASDDDILEQLRPTREFSEDQEEKLIEEEFDQEKISDNDQQAEAERKLQRADEEVTAADAVLTAQEAAGVDVARMRASWMRARVFLTQGHDAFLAKQFALAYGLSSQAREIADRIQDALDDDLNDEDPLDDVPEEALEEILDAEEDIREVESQLTNSTLAESLRAQILSLLNEARSNLTAASSAIDHDEFVLGYDLALQAQVLAAEAEDLLDTEDNDENEEEEDNVKDTAEHARDRIAQADEEIVKADARIAERQSEGKDVAEATTLLNEAKARLARSREALGASDFVLAYTLAREAKSLANESREGRLFRNVDHGDEDKQESDDSAAPGPDDASDRDDEEEELRDRDEQEEEELNEIREDEDGFEEQRREEEKQRKEDQREEEKRIKEEERERVEEERAATRDGRNNEDRPTPDASTDPEEVAPPDDNDENDGPEDGDNEQEDELEEEDGEDGSGSGKEDQEDKDESEDDEDSAEDEDEEDNDSGGDDD